MRLEIQAHVAALVWGRWRWVADTLGVGAVRLAATVLVAPAAVLVVVVADATYPLAGLLPRCADSEVGVGTVAVTKLLASVLEVRLGRVGRDSNEVEVSSGVAARQEPRAIPMVIIVVARIDHAAEEIAVALLEVLRAGIVTSVVGVAAAAKVQVRHKFTIPGAIGSAAVRRRASTAVGHGDHLAIEARATLGNSELRIVPLPRRGPRRGPSRAAPLGSLVERGPDAGGQKSHGVEILSSAVGSRSPRGSEGAVVSGRPHVGRGSVLKQQGASAGYSKHGRARAVLRFHTASRRRHKRDSTRFYIKSDVEVWVDSVTDDQVEQPTNQPGQ